MKATLKFLSVFFAVAFLAGCGTMSKKDQALLDSFDERDGLAVVEVEMRASSPTIIISGAGKAKTVFRTQSTGLAIGPRHVKMTQHALLANQEWILVKPGNGYSYVAKVVWQDSGTDSAVLEITSRTKSLPRWVPLKAVSPVPGERLVYMGYPRGSWTATFARAMSDDMIADIRNLPGGSGSPVFNLKGEVVGFANTYNRGTASCFGSRVQIVYKSSPSVPSLPTSTPDSGCSEITTAARFCERYGKCAEVSAPERIAVRPE